MHIQKASFVSYSLLFSATSVWIEPLQILFSNRYLFSEMSLHH